MNRREIVLISPTGLVYLQYLLLPEEKYTRTRGEAQRDGCPPLFYRRRTSVTETCENFDTMVTAVGWGPV